MLYSDEKILEDELASHSRTPALTAINNIVGSVQGLTFALEQELNQTTPGITETSSVPATSQGTRGSTNTGLVTQHDRVQHRLYGAQVATDSMPTEITVSAGPVGHSTARTVVASAYDADGTVLTSRPYETGNILGEQLESIILNSSLTICDLNESGSTDSDSRKWPSVSTIAESVESADTVIEVFPGSRVLQRKSKLHSPTRGETRTPSLSETTEAALNKMKTICPVHPHPQSDTTSTVSVIELAEGMPSSETTAKDLSYQKVSIPDHLPSERAVSMEEAKGSSESLSKLGPLSLGLAMTNKQRGLESHESSDQISDPHVGLASSTDSGLSDTEVTLDVKQSLTPVTYSDLSDGHLQETITHGREGLSHILREKNSDPYHQVNVSDKMNVPISNLSTAVYHVEADKLHESSDILAAIKPSLAADSSQLETVRFASGKDQPCDIPSFEVPYTVETLTHPVVRSKGQQSHVILQSDKTRTEPKIIVTPGPDVSSGQIETAENKSAFTFETQVSVSDIDINLPVFSPTEVAAAEKENKRRNRDSGYYSLPSSSLTSYNVLSPDRASLAESTSESEDGSDRQSGTSPPEPQFMMEALAETSVDEPSDDTKEQDIRDTTARQSIEYQPPTETGSGLSHTTLPCVSMEPEVPGVLDCETDQLVYADGLVTIQAGTWEQASATLPIIIPAGQSQSSQGYGIVGHAGSMPEVHMKPASAPLESGPTAQVGHDVPSAGSHTASVLTDTQPTEGYRTVLDVTPEICPVHGHLEDIGHLEEQGDLSAGKYPATSDDQVIETQPETNEPVEGTYVRQRKEQPGATEENVEAVSDWDSSQITPQDTAGHITKTPAVLPTTYQFTGGVDQLRSAPTQPTQSRGPADNIDTEICEESGLPPGVSEDLLMKASAEPQIEEQFEDLGAPDITEPASSILDTPERRDTTTHLDGLQPVQTNVSIKQPPQVVIAAGQQELNVDPWATQTEIVKTTQESSSPLVLTDKDITRVPYPVQVDLTQGSGPSYVSTVKSIPEGFAEGNTTLHQESTSLTAQTDVNVNVSDTCTDVEVSGPADIRESFINPAATVIKQSDKTSKPPITDKNWTGEEVGPHGGPTYIQQPDLDNYLTSDNRGKPTDGSHFYHSQPGDTSLLTSAVGTTLSSDTDDPEQQYALGQSFQASEAEVSQDRPAEWSLVTDDPQLTGTVAALDHHTEKVERNVASYHGDDDGTDVEVVWTEADVTDEGHFVSEDVNVQQGEYRDDSVRDGGVRTSPLWTHEYAKEEPEGDLSEDDWCLPPPSSPLGSLEQGASRSMGWMDPRSAESPPDALETSLSEDLEPGRGETGSIDGTPDSVTSISGTYVSRNMEDDVHSETITAQTPESVLTAEDHIPKDDMSAGRNTAEVVAKVTEEQGFRGTMPTIIVTPPTSAGVVIPIQQVGGEDTTPIDTDSIGEIIAANQEVSYGFTQVGISKVIPTSTEASDSLTESIEISLVGDNTEGSRATDEKDMSEILETEPLSGVFEFDEEGPVIHTDGQPTTAESPGQSVDDETFLETSPLDKEAELEGEAIDVAIQMVADMSLSDSNYDDISKYESTSGQGLEYTSAERLTKPELSSTMETFETPSEQAAVKTTGLPEIAEDRTLPLFESAEKSVLDVTGASVIKDSSAFETTSEQTASDETMGRVQTADGEIISSPESVVDDTRGLDYIEDLVPTESSTFIETRLETSADKETDWTISVPTFSTEETTFEDQTPVGFETQDDMHDIDESEVLSSDLTTVTDESLSQSTGSRSGSHPMGEWSELTMPDNEAITSWSTETAGSVETSAWMESAVEVTPELEGTYPTLETSTRHEATTQETSVSWTGDGQLTYGEPATGKVVSSELADQEDITGIAYYVGIGQEVPLETSVISRKEGATQGTESEVCDHADAEETLIGDEAEREYQEASMSTLDSHSDDSEEPKSQHPTEDGRGPVDDLGNDADEEPSDDESLDEARRLRFSHSTPLSQAVNDARLSGVMDSPASLSFEGVLSSTPREFLHERSLPGAALGAGARGRGEPSMSPTQTEFPSLETDVSLDEGYGTLQLSTAVGQNDTLESMEDVQREGPVRVDEPGPAGVASDHGAMETEEIMPEREGGVNDLGLASEADTPLLQHQEERTDGTECELCGEVSDTVESEEMVAAGHQEEAPVVSEQLPMYGYPHVPLTGRSEEFSAETVTYGLPGSQAYLDGPQFKVDQEIVREDEDIGDMEETVSSSVVPLVYRAEEEQEDVSEYTEDVPIEEDEEMTWAPSEEMQPMVMVELEIEVDTREHNPQVSPSDADDEGQFGDHTEHMDTPSPSTSPRSSGESSSGQVEGITSIEEAIEESKARRIEGMQKEIQVSSMHVLAVSQQVPVVVSSTEDSEEDPGFFELVHYKAPEPRSRRKKAKSERSSQEKDLVRSEMSSLTTSDFMELASNIPTETGYVVVAGSCSSSDFEESGVSTVSGILDGEDASSHHFDTADELQSEGDILENFSMDAPKFMYPSTVISRDSTTGYTHGYTRIGATDKNREIDSADKTIHLSQQKDSSVNVSQMENTDKHRMIAHEDSSISLFVNVGDDLDADISEDEMRFMINEAAQEEDYSDLVTFKAPEPQGEELTDMKDEELGSLPDDSSVPSEATEPSHIFGTSKTTYQASEATTGVNIGAEVTEGVREEELVQGSEEGRPVEHTGLIPTGVVQSTDTAHIYPNQDSDESLRRNLDGCEIAEYTSKNDMEYHVDETDEDLERDSVAEDDHPGSRERSGSLFVNIDEIIDDITEDDINYLNNNDVTTEEATVSVGIGHMPTVHEESLPEKLGQPQEEWDDFPTDIRATIAGGMSDLVFDMMRSRTESDVSMLVYVGDSSYNVEEEDQDGADVDEISSSERIAELVAADGRKIQEEGDHVTQAEVDMYKAIKGEATTIHKAIDVRTESADDLTAMLDEIWRERRSLQGDGSSTDVTENLPVQVSDGSTLDVSSSSQTTETDTEWNVEGKGPERDTSRTSIHKKLTSEEPSSATLSMDEYLENFMDQHTKWLNQTLEQLPTIGQTPTIAVEEVAELSVYQQGEGFKPSKTRDQEETIQLDSEEVRVPYQAHFKSEVTSQGIGAESNVTDVFGHQLHKEGALEAVSVAHGPTKAAEEGPLQPEEEEDEERFETWSEEVMTPYEKYLTTEPSQHGADGYEPTEVSEESPAGPEEEEERFESWSEEVVTPYKKRLTTEPSQPEEEGERFESWSEEVVTPYAKRLTTEPSEPEEEEESFETWSEEVVTPYEKRLTTEPSQHGADGYEPTEVSEEGPAEPEEEEERFETWSEEGVTPYEKRLTTEHSQPEEEEEERFESWSEEVITPYEKRLNTESSQHEADGYEATEVSEERPAESEEEERFETWSEEVVTPYEKRLTTESSQHAADGYEPTEVSEEGPAEPEEEEEEEERFETWSEEVVTPYEKRLTTEPTQHGADGYEPTEASEEGPAEPEEEGEEEEERFASWSEEVITPYEKRVATESSKHDVDSYAQGEASEDGIVEPGEEEEEEEQVESWTEEVVTPYETRLTTETSQHGADGYEPTEASEEGPAEPEEEDRFETCSEEVVTPHEKRLTTEPSPHGVDGYEPTEASEEGPAEPEEEERFETCSEEVVTPHETRLTTEPSPHGVDGYEPTEASEEGPAEPEDEERFETWSEEVVTPYEKRLTTEPSKHGADGYELTEASEEGPAEPEEEERFETWSEEVVTPYEKRLTTEPSKHGADGYELTEASEEGPAEPEEEERFEAWSEEVVTPHEKRLTTEPSQQGVDGYEPTEASEEGPAEPEEEERFETWSEEVVTPHEKRLTTEPSQHGVDGYEPTEASEEGPAEPEEEERFETWSEEVVTPHEKRLTTEPSQHGVDGYEPTEASEEGPAELEEEERFETWSEEVVTPHEKRLTTEPSQHGVDGYEPTEASEEGPAEPEEEERFETWSEEVVTPHEKRLTTEPSQQGVDGYEPTEASEEGPAEPEEEERFETWSEEVVTPHEKRLTTEPSQHGVDGYELTEASEEGSAEPEEEERFEAWSEEVVTPYEKRLTTEPSKHGADGYELTEASEEGPAEPEEEERFEAWSEEVVTPHEKRLTTEPSQHGVDGYELTEASEEGPAEPEEEERFESWSEEVVTPHEKRLTTEPSQHGVDGYEPTEASEEGPAEPEEEERFETWSEEVVTPYEKRLTTETSEHMADGYEPIETSEEGPAEPGEEVKERFETWSEEVITPYEKRVATESSHHGASYEPGEASEEGLFEPEEEEEQFESWTEEVVTPYEKRLTTETSQHGTDGYEATGASEERPAEPQEEEEETFESWSEEVITPYEKRLATKISQHGADGYGATEASEESPTQPEEEEEEQRFETWSEEVVKPYEKRLPTETSQHGADGYEATESSEEENEETAQLSPRERVDKAMAEYAFQDEGDDSFGIKIRELSHGEELLIDSMLVEGDESPTHQADARRKTDSSLDTSDPEIHLIRTKNEGTGGRQEEESDTLVLSNSRRRYNSHKSAEFVDTQVMGFDVFPEEKDAEVTDDVQGLQQLILSHHTIMDYEVNGSNSTTQAEVQVLGLQPTPKPRPFQEPTLPERVLRDELSMPWQEDLCQAELDIEIKPYIDRKKKRKAARKKKEEERKKERDDKDREGGGGADKGGRDGGSEGGSSTDEGSGAQRDGQSDGDDQTGGKDEQPSGSNQGQPHDMADQFGLEPKTYEGPTSEYPHHAAHNEEAPLRIEDLMDEVNSATVATEKQDTPLSDIRGSGSLSPGEIPTYMNSMGSLGEVALDNAGSAATEVAASDGYVIEEAQIALDTVDKGEELSSVLTSSGGSVGQDWLNRLPEAERSLSMSDLDLMTESSERPDWYSGRAMSTECITTNSELVGVDAMGMRTVSNDSITFVFMTRPHSYDVMLGGRGIPDESPAKQRRASEPSQPVDEDDQGGEVIKKADSSGETALLSAVHERASSDEIHPSAAMGEVGRPKAYSLDATTLPLMPAPLTKRPDLGQQSQGTGSTLYSVLCAGSMGSDSVFGTSTPKKDMGLLPIAEPIGLNDPHMASSMSVLPSTSDLPSSPTWEQVDSRESYLTRRGRSRSLSPNSLKDISMKLAESLSRAFKAKAEVIEGSTQTGSSLEDLQSQEPTGTTPVQGITSEDAEQDITDRGSSERPGSLPFNVLLERALETVRKGMGDLDSEDGSSLTQTPSSDLVKAFLESAMMVPSDMALQGNSSDTIPGSLQQVSSECSVPNSLGSSVEDLHAEAMAATSDGHITTVGRTIPVRNITLSDMDMVQTDIPGDLRKVDPRQDLTSIETENLIEAPEQEAGEKQDASATEAADMSGHSTVVCAYGYPYRTIETQTYPELRVIETQTQEIVRTIETQTMLETWQDCELTQSHGSLSDQSSSQSGRSSRRVTCVDTGVNPSPPYTPLTKSPAHKFVFTSSGDIAIQTDLTPESSTSYPQNLNQESHEALQTPGNLTTSRTTLTFGSDDTIELHSDESLQAVHIETLGSGNRVAHSTPVKKSESGAKGEVDIKPLSVEDLLEAEIIEDDVSSVEESMDKEDLHLPSTHSREKLQASHIEVDIPLYTFNDPSLAGLREEHERLVAFMKTAKEEREQRLIRRREMLAGRRGIVTDSKEDLSPALSTSDLHLDNSLYKSTSGSQMNSSVTNEPETNTNTDTEEQNSRSVESTAAVVTSIKPSSPRMDRDSEIADEDVPDAKEVLGPENRRELDTSGDSTLSQSSNLSHYGIEQDRSSDSDLLQKTINEINSIVEDSSAVESSLPETCTEMQQTTAKDDSSPVDSEEACTAQTQGELSSMEVPKTSTLLGTESSMGASEEAQIGSVGMEPKSLLDQDIEDLMTGELGGSTGNITEQAAQVKEDLSQGAETSEKVPGNDGPRRVFVGRSQPPIPASHLTDRPETAGATVTRQDVTTERTTPAATTSIAMAVSTYTETAARDTSARLGLHGAMRNINNTVELNLLDSPRDSLRDVRDEAVETDFGDSDYSDELERLRRERQHILDMLAKDVMPSKLQVELAEAQLNYIIGQTDTLLNTVDEPWEFDADKLAEMGYTEPHLGEITNEYLVRYRMTLERSRKEVEARIHILERENERSSRSRERTKKLSRMRREAQIEAFKIEREREQFQYERTRYLPRSRSDSPAHRPISDKDSTKSESKESLNIPLAPIYARFLTPKQRKEHLIKLRRGFLKTSERVRTRSVSPDQTQPNRAHSPALSYTSSDAYSFVSEDFTTPGFSLYPSTGNIPPGYSASTEYGIHSSPNITDQNTASSTSVADQDTKTNNTATITSRSANVVASPESDQHMQETVSRYDTFSNRNSHRRHRDTSPSDRGSAVSGIELIDDDTQRLLRDYQVARSRAEEEIQRARATLEKRGAGHRDSGTLSSPSRARSVLRYYYPNG